MVVIQVTPSGSRIVSLSATRANGGTPPRSIKAFWRRFGGGTVGRYPDVNSRADDIRSHRVVWRQVDAHGGIEGAAALRPGKHAAARRADPRGGRVADCRRCCGRSTAPGLA